MNVHPIPYHMVRPWLLERHYARIVPSVILHSFGLFHDGELAGVCTFSPPPRMFNGGYGLFTTPDHVDVFELSRLVIADGLPDNALSRFVAKSLKQLPAPCAVVSYADANYGHHGYIYQATNWLYTGATTANRPRFVDTRTGRQIHERVINHRFGSSSVENLPDHIDVSLQEPKHRYVTFVGDRRQRKAMRRNLAYEVLPYPKGNNRRYDAPDVAAQGALF